MVKKEKENNMKSKEKGALGKEFFKSA